MCADAPTKRRTAATPQADATAQRGVWCIHPITLWIVPPVGVACQSAVADEGTGEDGEGQEVLGFALVAAVQTTQPPSQDIVRSLVEVRAGDPDGDAQTGPLGDQVDLRAFLAPVDRIRTCRVPDVRARMLTASIARRDQSRPPREPSSSRMTRCNLAQTGRCSTR